MHYFSCPGLRIIPIISEVKVAFVEKDGMKIYYLDVCGAKVQHMKYVEKDSTFEGALELIREFGREIDSNPTGGTVFLKWAIPFNPER